MSTSAERSLRTDARSFPELFVAKMPNTVAIPPEEVPKQLGFEQFGRPLVGFRKNFIEDMIKSHWFSMDQDRVIFEVRRPTKLYPEILNTVSEVVISDFDDTLFKATAWHAEEYKLVETDKVLQARGVAVDRVTAKEIYEKSKIRIPGKAVSEARYTPRLNLALLTNFAEHKANGASEEVAMDEMNNWLSLLTEMVMKDGDNSLRRILIDPDFYKIFMGNDPSRFAYSEIEAVFSCLR